MAHVESGIDPAATHFVKGAAEKVSENHGEQIGRVLCKAFYGVLEAGGREKSASAHHLRMIATAPAWTAHSEEVVDSCVQTIQACSQMSKSATSDVLNALAKAFSYSSLGAGLGGGSLYWLLNRQVNHDQKEIEAMRNQVDYYNQLASELDASMKRKYQYQEAA